MANRETMKIDKLTKYGFRLDSGEMVYASPEVMELVSKSLPCEIEVLEEKPYGKSKKQITKVKVLSNKFTNEFTTTKNKTPQEEVRPKVDSGNILGLAVELYKLDQTKSLHSICEELAKEFNYLRGELK